MTVVDPREEGKLAEEIQKNLIQELKKRTDRRAGRTARGAGRTVGRTVRRTDRRTVGRTVRRTDRRTDRAAQNKRRDTCTERTGTTGRAEAGRWSKLPGRKYHGGDPYSELILDALKVMIPVPAAAVRQM